MRWRADTSVLTQRFAFPQHRHSSFLPEQGLRDVNSLRPKQENREAVASQLGHAVIAFRELLSIVRQPVHWHPWLMATQPAEVKEGVETDEELCEAAECDGCHQEPCPSCFLLV